MPAIVDSSHRGRSAGEAQTGWWWWVAAADDRAIMGYHLEVAVTDVLIRDVPDEVVAALDVRASRLGLSRSEYVRRRLAQDAATTSATVTVQDLSQFTELFSDLDDPEVMSQAWR